MCRLHPPIGFVAQPANHSPLGFEAKPRNRHGDFVGKITKPQLQVLGPNQKTRASGFEAKLQEP
jgi:hypothetical protein